MTRPSDDEPTPASPDDVVTQDSEPEESEPSPTEVDWKARRRLAEIFGEVLPSTTRDERDPGAGRPRDESASDEWLRRQVPPHHGGQ